MIRRRAQVFPIFFAFIPVLFIGAIAIWNILGFQGGGRAAVDSAARAAAQAALRSNDSASLAQYGRWYIEPDSGDLAARNYVYMALQGLSGTGDYEAAFAEDLLGAVYDDGGALDPGGTYDYGVIGTGYSNQPGVDVEILNPGSTYGSSWATRSYNGTTYDTRAGTLILCTASDGSSGVESELNGSCYAQTTVIVRIRLRVPQFGGGATMVEATSLASAGTDTQNP